MKVSVFSKRFNKGTGYDVRIMDESATVQDYLDAINNFIDDENLIRGANHSVCRGCDSCCRERLPLTCFDVLKMQGAPAAQAAMTGGQPLLLGFLTRFTHVYVEGPAVDITFGRHPHGACIWLDEEAGCCRNYAWRPLVCQSFICIPGSKRAGELRSAVINQGMDELVRQAILTAEKAGVPMVMHEADDPMVTADDWPQNPFSGKTGYDDVLLRDLCPGKLWHELTAL